MRIIMQITQVHGANNAFPMQVDSPDSFENVASKWVEEISDNCPGVRMVLTALKCDLRKDEDLNENPNAITFEQGLAKAKEIGAVKYLGKTCVFSGSNRGLMSCQNVRPSRTVVFARHLVKQLRLPST